MTDVDFQAHWILCKKGKSEFFSEVDRFEDRRRWTEKLKVIDNKRKKKKEEESSSQSALNVFGTTYDVCEPVYSHVYSHTGPDIVFA